MLEVDGVEFEGVFIKCKVCGKEFEVKPYAKDRRVLCGNLECSRIDVRNRMRESRKRRKEKCSGCEVLSHG